MCEERRQSAAETSARAPTGAFGDGPGPTIRRRADGNRTVRRAERNRAVRRPGAFGDSGRGRRQETLSAWFRGAFSALLLHPMSSLAPLLARREREAFRADVFSKYEASLETLADADRSALSRHWLRRARSEARISAAFSKMVPLLREVRATEVVVDLIGLSAADELRHSEVCVHVAERYAGRRLEPAAVGETPLPAFGCGDERLQAALLVAGTCCINETLATVWLTLGIEAARTPLTRAAHRATCATRSTTLARVGRTWPRMRWTERCAQRSATAYRDCSQQTFRCGSRRIRYFPPKGSATTARRTTPASSVECGARCAKSFFPASSTSGFRSPRNAGARSVPRSTTRGSNLDSWNPGHPPPHRHRRPKPEGPPFRRRRHLGSDSEFFDRERSRISRGRRSRRASA